MLQPRAIWFREGLPRKSVGTQEGWYEMGEASEVVARAQQLSPTLNASATMDEMRQRLCEIIDSEIDKSATVFVPF